MSEDRLEDPLMLPSLRLLAGLASITLSAGAVLAQLPRTVELPPRYQFQAGQEIAFKDTMVFKYGQRDNAGAIDDNSEWTVWVARGNADGSFRLVIRHRGTTVQTIGKTKYEQPQMYVVYADVFPDGRVRPNKTIRYRNHPGALFPPLPQTALEAKSGWEAMRTDNRIVCKPLPAPTGLVFEAVTEAPENKIYLSSYSTRSTFDAQRVLLTKREMT